MFRLPCAIERNGDFQPPVVTKRAVRRAHSVQWVTSELRAFAGTGEPALQQHSQRVSCSAASVPATGDGGCAALVPAGARVSPCTAQQTPPRPAGVPHDRGAASYATVALVVLTSACSAAGACPATAVRRGLNDHCPHRRRRRHQRAVPGAQHQLCRRPGARVREGARWSVCC